MKFLHVYNVECLSTFFSITFCTTASFRVTHVPPNFGIKVSSQCPSTTGSVPSLKSSNSGTGVSHGFDSSTIALNEQSSQNVNQLIAPRKPVGVDHDFGVSTSHSTQSAITSR